MGQRVVIIDLKISKDIPHRLLTDTELVKMGIRNDHLFINRSVFRKNQEEKEKLKVEKANYKKYLNSLN